MPAEVVFVNSQKMTDTFQAIGSVEAVEGITVTSEIDGIIKSLPFTEGGYINQGDLIAQLDDTQLAAEFARAEALYNQGIANYDRIKNLAEQRVSPQQELDNALANLKVSEANLELAKSRLDKTKITAPFSGTIGTRKVSVGQFIRTGQEITELANISHVRVLFTVPEKLLASLKKNSLITISSPVYPGYEINGKILAIEPVLDTDTRTVRVVGYVKNPDQKFRPGMSANINVVLTERPEALTVPNQAIFANGNQSFVYIVNEDSTVAQVPVTLGLQLSDIVEITDGLQPGMKVIQAGHQKLYPGAKVIPIIMQKDTSGQQSY
jgi:membrane fusion protein (multidrug efflux system)